LGHLTIARAVSDAQRVADITHGGPENRQNENRGIRFRALTLVITPPQVVTK
jgi:hypothetical protein